MPSLQAQARAAAKRAAARMAAAAARAAEAAAVAEAARANVNANVEARAAAEAFKASAVVAQAAHAAHASQHVANRAVEEALRAAKQAPQMPQTSLMPLHAPPPPPCVCGTPRGACVCGVAALSTAVPTSNPGVCKPAVRSFADPHSRFISGAVVAHVGSAANPGRCNYFNSGRSAGGHGYPNGHSSAAVVAQPVAMRGGMEEEEPRPHSSDVAPPPTVSG